MSETYLIRKTVTGWLQRSLILAKVLNTSSRNNPCCLQVLYFSCFGSQLYNWAFVENEFLAALSAILPAFARISVALPCLKILYNSNIRTPTYVTLKTVDDCPNYKTYAHKSLGSMRPVVSLSENLYITPKSILLASYTPR